MALRDPHMGCRPTCTDVPRAATQLRACPRCRCLYPHCPRTQQGAQKEPACCNAVHDAATGVQRATLCTVLVRKQPQGFVQASHIQDPGKLSPDLCYGGWSAGTVHPLLLCGATLPCI